MRKMKKTYITPQTTVEVLENETMLAASKFEVTGNSIPADVQQIETTPTEYESEFCTKGYGQVVFDDSWE